MVCEYSRPKDIDAAILPVIEDIWKLGINTFGSCAGHPGEVYPTGFPKDAHASIMGELHSLDEIGKLEQYLVEKFAAGCPCGTCRLHSIRVQQDGDATGFREPVTYSFTIVFRGRFEDGQLIWKEDSP